MSLKLKSAAVALPVSAGELVEVRPHGDAGPCYLVRVPTFRTRAGWQRAVIAGGIKVPSDAQLLAELRRGLLVWVEEGGQAEAIGILDAYEALRDERAAAAEMDAGDEDDGAAEAPAPEAEAADAAEAAEWLRLSGLVVDMQRQLVDVHEPLARMMADRAYGSQMTIYLAAQHFLAGWTGIDARFETERGLPTEATMARLGDDLAAVGAQALALMAPSRAQRKNSVSPSR